MHNSPSEDAPKYLNSESPLRPITFMIAECIQGERTKLPLKVLMNPGSDFSYIPERVLPKGAVPKTAVRAAPTKTLTGIQTFDRMVELKGVILPEFSRSKKIDEISVCYVAKQHTNTDVILGNDFLQAIGINCNGTNCQRPRSVTVCTSSTLCRSVHRTSPSPSN